MSSYAKMWFGTEYKMQWIDCPLQGADVSPLGWSAEGTLLNGGGYAKHSWASHKNYVFEWRQSSARRMAQIMHNYRDGVYGRGLIHFVDPLTMDFNVLPKQWAYPALMAGEANNPFLRGTALSTTPTPTNTFNLPIQGAVVPLGSLSGFRAADSVFIPRPENKVLQLWGLYTTSGNATAGVYAIPVNDNGTNGTPVRLTPTALNGGTPAEYNLATGKGVRLCVMKTSSAAGVVNLFGLVGRLADATGYRSYDWTGAIDNSTSTVSDSAGNVMLNLFTNPRAVASGTVAPSYGVQSSAWAPEGLDHSIWMVEEGLFLDELSADSTVAVYAESPNQYMRIVSWFPEGEVDETFYPDADGLLRFYTPEGYDFNFYSSAGRWGMLTIVDGNHPDLMPFHGSMPTVAPGSAPLTEWVGGQGNSGCRFVGSPTYIENTGVNGGQISYAASFKEVGDWQ